MAKARKVKKTGKAKARKITHIAVKKKTSVKKLKLKKLPKSVLNKYKQLLIKEREAAGGTLSHITGDTLNKSQRDASGDLSGYSYHMADMASDDYERDFTLGRATDEQKMIYLIDEAIKRIGDGTYGYCLQCGKAIAKNRLAAIPYSELCIECKKANEGK